MNIIITERQVNRHVRIALQYSHVAGLSPLNHLDIFIIGSKRFQCKILQDLEKIVLCFSKNRLIIY